MNLWTKLSPSHLSNSVSEESRSKLAAGEERLPATDWILIVDDEFDIISIFKEALMNKGFRVFGFTDPLLSLEHFQINVKQYGLVISDLRMPGMNGYEFVKKINEIKPEIKIFLMTAFEVNDVEFKRLLPKVKIEGLLQKPISLAHMVITVSKYMSSK